MHALAWASLNEPHRREPFPCLDRGEERNDAYIRLAVSIALAVTMICFDKSAQAFGLGGKERNRFPQSDEVGFAAAFAADQYLRLAQLPDLLNTLEFNYYFPLAVCLHNFPPDALESCVNLHIRLRWYSFIVFGRTKSLEIREVFLKNL